MNETVLPGGSTRSIEVGAVLFGEYEVVARLRSGGMGEVYRAVHRSLGEQRAIKVMRPELASDESATKLFLREARALLDVHSEAVVRCHDLLRDDAGRFYLITEFVSGPSLAEVLASRRLTFDEIVALRDRMAQALSAAHAKGIVHRDVSPDNIILEAGRPERARLIDFGIAHLMDTRTTLQGFKGKLAYASPEQMGLFGGHVDARSDLYSLGVVLVEAATGRRLFDETTLVQAIDARRVRPAPPLGMLPRSLRSELRKLLEPDPARRLAAAELLLSRDKRGSPGPLRWAIGAAAVLGLGWLAFGAGMELVARLRERVLTSPAEVASPRRESRSPEANASPARDVRRRERVAPQRAPSREPANDGCNAEAARTQAAQLYSSGRACEALERLDACCPAGDRRCEDMRSLVRSECESR